MPEVQPSDRRLLAFIDGFITARGFAPTYREMAAAIGIGSTGSITRALRRLADAGLVRWEPRQGRTVHPIPQRPTATRR